MRLQHERHKDLVTQQFVIRASIAVSEAAADLGALIGRPSDPACAKALLDRIAGIADAGRKVGLVEIARLADEAERPLTAALLAKRPLDRLSLQTVGWAVQALDGALSAAAAGCAPVALAA